MDSASERTAAADVAFLFSSCRQPNTASARNESSQGAIRKSPRNTFATRDQNGILNIHTVGGPKGYPKISRTATRFSPPPVRVCNKSGLPRTSAEADDTLIFALPVSTVTCERRPPGVPLLRFLRRPSHCTTACRAGRWQWALEHCAVGIHRFPSPCPADRCGLHRENRVATRPARRPRQPEHPARRSLARESPLRNIHRHRRAHNRRRQPDGKRRRALPQAALSHARRPLARLRRIPSNNRIASAAGTLRSPAHPHRVSLQRAVHCCFRRARAARA